MEDKIETSRSEQLEEKKETQRIEAFSDGIFSIAITLLVLDLKPAIDRSLNADPKTTDYAANLFIAMLNQWPTLLAFITSFATIGIMWINHHRLFNLITRSNHTLLILNLFLLFGITVVPFPTALLGEELAHFQEAVIIYNALFVLIAIAFNLLWFYSTKNGRLLHPNVDMQMVRRITNQYRYGIPVYVLALVLAFFPVIGPFLSLGFDALLAAFFLLPGVEPAKPGQRKSNNSQS
jgi:uncharacterized membrane protein